MTITEEVISYIAKRSPINLLGLDWIEMLRLADSPINLICNHNGTMGDNHKNLIDALLSRNKKYLVLVMDNV